MITEEHTIRQRSGGYIRKAKLLLPESGFAKTLCVFLDGEIYLEKMDAQATMDRLVKEQRMPPVASLFLSHVDTEHRHRDFACNADYQAFVGKDVLDWSQSRIPTLEPGEHAIIGLSLSGLAAAYIRHRFPDRLSRVLCQSGSFWWNDEWFTRNLPDAPPGRYWISVGDLETQTGLEHAPSGMRQDISQLDAVNHFVESLQAAGQHEVRHQVFDGKHDADCWKQELSAALEWLLA